MKITNVRINGIENPVGFAYDYLLCSWNVEEAKGKKQINAIIEVSDSEDFSDILYKKEAADLKQNGEKLEVERMAAKTGSMEQAIRVLAAEKNSGKR